MLMLHKILHGPGRKVRVVYLPAPAEQERLRALLPELQQAERQAAAAAGIPDVAHGFVVGRSPVTAAWAHVGPFALTVSVDLRGWFDHVRPEQIADGLKRAGWPDERAVTTANSLCRRGVPPSPRPDELAPRQGLATSPTAANLAAVAFDAQVVAALTEKWSASRWVYTRYADDLCVSLTADDNRGQARAVIAILEEVANRFGWPVAVEKTSVYYARAGRRVVCGIAVGPDRIYPKRSDRRRLRAARRNDPDSSSCRGLAEWCSLKRPRACRRGRSIVKTITTTQEETGNNPAVVNSKRKIIIE